MAAATDVTDPVGVAAPLRVASPEVAGFLFQEARLLDERRYDEWLSLFADEGLYWMPSDDLTADPATSVTIVYEDVEALRARIGRLNTGKQYAQDPPSRICRAVSNVYIDGGAEDTEDLTVRSVLVAVEARRHHTKRVYGAHVSHILRPSGASFAIVRKRVDLVDNDQFFENLTFLL
jgi:3-phenylpropionate/cinnamic acid dioxygenase small subunit